MEDRNETKIINDLANYIRRTGSFGKGSFFVARWIYTFRRFLYKYLKEIIEKEEQNGASKNANKNAK